MFYNYIFCLFWAPHQRYTAYTKCIFRKMQENSADFIIKIVHRKVVMNGLYGEPKWPGRVMSIHPN